MAELPERERLTMFREMIGRGVANMEIVPLSAECSAELELRMLPGASVMWGGYTPHRFEKSRDLSRSDDDCVLGWSNTPTSFSQLGRQITVGAGPALMISSADKARVESLSPLQKMVTVKIPRAALKPQVKRLEDSFLQPIPAETDALRLLKTYLAAVRADHAAAGLNLQRAMVLHICDLVALALGATRDGMELASGRGLRAARLDSMKRHVLTHLGDASLSVRDVARVQGVSPRYVQQLFESEGGTFSSFLLQARLTLVHRRLADPGSLSLPIGAIAADCGFGDLSYFNQCFPRRYGETPSDVRSRARRRSE